MNLMHVITTKDLAKPHELAHEVFRLPVASATITQTGESYMAQVDLGHGMGMIAEDCSPDAIMALLYEFEQCHDELRTVTIVGNESTVELERHQARMYFYNNYHTH